jgi:hypothetical protein
MVNTMRDGPGGAKSLHIMLLPLPEMASHFPMRGLLFLQMSVMPAFCPPDLGV